MTTRLWLGYHVPVALVALLLTGWSYGAGDVEVGPENGGLRLGLAVLTTTSPQGDSFTVCLDFSNTGTDTIVLVGQPQQSADYGEYVRREVTFVTFPEILPEIGQTVERGTGSVVPTAAIAPGRRYRVAWTSVGNCLKSDYRTFTAPIFPGPGLYGVRASIVVNTASRKGLLLVSNGVHVSVGGSIKLPKYATARVTAADAAKGTVTLAVGAIHGTAVGDSFWVYKGPGAMSWDLAVAETRERESVARVTARRGLKTPSVPPVDSEARLLPQPNAEPHGNSR